MFTTSEIDRWLVSHGADLNDNDLNDSVLTGCMIYCEPGSAKANVINYIENKMQVEKMNLGRGDKIGKSN